MIRDLDDEGLGQNKVLCSSSGVELLWSTTMQAPQQRSPHQGDRSPATRRFLALEPHWLRFFLIASFLLPFPCRLFLVASSLSPHLARFVTHPFAGCPRFCLGGSMGLIISLAIGDRDHHGSSYCGSNHRWLSHWRGDVNKRDCFGDK